MDKLSNPLDKEEMSITKEPVFPSDKLGNTKPDVIIETKNKTFDEIAYELGAQSAKNLLTQVIGSENSFQDPFFDGWNSSTKEIYIEQAHYDSIFKILVDHKFAQIDKRLSQIEERLDKLELSPERTTNNLFGDKDVIDS